MTTESVEHALQKLREPAVQGRIRSAIRSATLEQLRSEGITLTPAAWGELHAKLMTAKDPGDVLAGAAAVAIGVAISDARLKSEIVHLTTLENGLRIHEFSFKGFQTRWRGVLAQEVLQTHPNAVFEDVIGFLAVDYSKLGVPFCASN